jgi:hypothetical protein
MDKTMKKRMRIQYLSKRKGDLRQYQTSFRIRLKGRREACTKSMTSIGTIEKGNIGCSTAQNTEEKISFLDNIKVKLQSISTCFQQLKSNVL